MCVCNIKIEMINTQFLIKLDYIFQYVVYMTTYLNI